MAETPLPAEKLHEDGLVGHLTDLRNSVVWSLVVFGITFFAMFPFTQEIYDLFAQPLLREIPEGSKLISIGVLGPFLVPLKVVLFCAFCVSLPHTLYQLWRFVAPGLYRKEKGIALPLVVSSTLLFYLGMAFAYVLVFRIVFAFIVDFAPASVSVMPDVQSHLSFALLMFMTFGIAFEVPVAVFLLTRVGILEIEALRRARRYVFVGAFVVAAIVTPPDVISQFMLAIPVWLLYEVGIWVSVWLSPPQTKEEKRD